MSKHAPYYYGALLNKESETFTLATLTKTFDDITDMIARDGVLLQSVAIKKDGDKVYVNCWGVSAKQLEGAKCD